MNYPHLSIHPRVAAITEQEAKQFFHTVITTSLGGKQFDFDHNLIEVLRKLNAYAIRKPVPGIDLKKGICLIGPTGVGKNTVMGWLRQFEQCLHGHAWREIESRKLDRDCRESGNLDPIKNYDGHALCIHDAAYVESVSINLFGTPTNPTVEAIFQHEENAWQRHGQRLFITTNLPVTADHGPSWETVFGPNRPLFSRIFEMCNIIYLKGPDRRKL